MSRCIACSKPGTRAAPKHIVIPTKPSYIANAQGRWCEACYARNRREIKRVNIVYKLKF